jgi:serpin B
MFLPLLFLQEAAVLAQNSPKAPTDRAAAVEGNNAFAVELYGQLRNQSGNLFFSPESISIALAMTYAGARGGTASEMAKTLHFTLPPERLHPAIGAILGDLNATHNGYELRVANALWAQKDYKFTADFSNLMKTDYGAGFNLVDFRAAPEAARLTINKWVEQKTEEKIKDLLKPGVLSGTTRLVLTNAIYFKGDWQHQFNKTLTKDEEFHVSPSQTVQAPLMHREDGFKYFDGGTFQALEIPYKTGELSMIVLLPNNGGGLPALEQLMTPANLQQWLGQLHPVSKVILTVPKFKMTREFELNAPLGAMGMRLAFMDGVADFSGMTGDSSRKLFISAVIHKAFVAVDEEGTEAAAATGVIMRAATAHAPDRTPPVVFRADHPFVFLIRDNRSNGTLFMGRLTDPTL